MPKKWLHVFRSALTGGLSLIVTSCGNKPYPVEAPKILPAFDGNAAYEEVENIVSFGSRAHGTTGHRHVFGYLQARLKSFGYEPRIQSFTPATPRGRLTFQNLEAIHAGSTDRVIIVSTHYDSMQGAPDDFQAANSAGSGPAVLLELARVIRDADLDGPEIRFLFFDGQEPLSQHSSGDGLRGSSEYAKELVARGEKDRILAVINLDLVGDRDLSITVAKNVSNDLRLMLLEASHLENARSIFKLFPAIIGDDHSPFYSRFIPSINIIDFEYGSEPGRNDYWRTHHDTLDKISAESLDIIGRITLRMIVHLSDPALEKPRY